MPVDERVAQDTVHCKAVNYQKLYPCGKFAKSDVQCKLSQRFHRPIRSVYKYRTPNRANLRPPRISDTPQMDQIRACARVKYRGDGAHLGLQQPDGGRNLVIMLLKEADGLRVGLLPASRVLCYIRFRLPRLPRGEAVREV